MSKHYSHSKDNNVTGIDAAIKKYGKENFKVDILEECPPEKLDERERYYIQKYNSYNEGYNLTLGGQDGLGSRKLLNKEQVIKALEQYKTIRQASQALNCGERTLSNYMKENQIPHYYHPAGRVENILNKGCPFEEGHGTKEVHIVELNKDFSSLKECAQWLIDHGYSKATTMEAARKSLSRHLNGGRGSYLNMHFQYI